MSNIEKVLILLCKQINLCTEINLTPDHLLLAKHNKQNEDSMKKMWCILNVLSNVAVNKINPELNFQHYGVIKSTKLSLAYLGYCAVEFYELSENSNNSRELLLALGWLIASQNCLDTIIREKLNKSILGRECINSNVLLIEDYNKSIEDNNPSLSISSQIHLLIYKCNKINNNLKAISELIEEKIRLITKIHDASLNSNNLPHLNVAELVLIKKLFSQTKNNEYILRDCENGFEQLHNVGVLLEIYTKWRKKEKIFFDWMETILDESKNDTVNLPIENNGELSTIICIIRHLMKKKIHTIKFTDIELPPENINNNNILKFPCVSRFLRVHEQFSNNYDNYETKMLQQLNEINQSIDKKMNKFNLELKLLMKSIPNCLQV